MKVPIGISVLFLALAIPAPSDPGVVYVSPEAGSLVRLDDGTPLIVTPDSDITSGDNEIGETVTFKVIHACRINGVLLIQPGAHVEARVDKSKHSKMLGRAGQLQVSVHNTQAVDGSTLRVRATLSNRGNRNEDETVHVIKYLPLPFHSGILFNGRDAILKAGAPLTIFVDEDADFLLAGGPTGCRPRRMPTRRAARLTPAPSPHKAGKPDRYSFPPE